MTDIAHAGDALAYRTYVATCPGCDRRQLSTVAIHPRCPNCRRRYMRWSSHDTESGSSAWYICPRCRTIRAEPGTEFAPCPCGTIIPSHFIRAPLLAHGNLEATLVLLYLRCGGREILILAAILGWLLYTAR